MNKDGVLVKADEVSVCLQNMKLGSAVSDARSEGEIVVNGASFHFILKHMNSGKLLQLREKVNESVVVEFHKQTKTHFTKQGYVLLHVFLSKTLARIYIKKNELRSFCTAVKADNKSN